MHGGPLGAPGDPPQWTAEREITPAEARGLITAQFPELANASVEAFGNGWDNTAYLIGGTYVFRFPRRTIAVELIEREVALLPLIAPSLPAPIPVPCFAGSPANGYPWPFAGYRHLDGTTVCALPDAAGGEALARGLGAFVRALHAIDPSEAMARGLPPDQLGRLAHERRFAMARDRLAGLHARGIVEDPQPLLDEMREIAPRPGEGALRIVHGDLYARHVLVDEHGELSGVIDWGDMHLGDPALDLAVANLVLAAEHQPEFFAAYGPVDARTRARARYRAIYHALVVADYGMNINDAGLRHAGTCALSRIRAASAERS
jgi:aminoglycoside phosphotransferase (APT) family kinase protein